MAITTLRATMARIETLDNIVEYLVFPSWIRAASKSSRRKCSIHGEIRYIAKVITQNISSATRHAKTGKATSLLSIPLGSVDRLASSAAIMHSWATPMNPLIIAAKISLISVVPDT